MQKFDFSNTEYQRFVSVCPFSDEELKVLELRRRGRGAGAKRDSMGRYSRESGYSEAEERSRGMSYMISHDQSKDHMMKQLGEMMRVANDSDKRILEQCMRDLDRA